MNPLKNKVYNCNKCEKQFIGEDNFRNHYTKVHATEDPVKCPNCDKVMKHSRSLNKHMKTVCFQNGSEQNSLVPCPKCHKLVKNFKGHLKTHEKRVCEFCSKVLGSKYYPEHIRDHHSGFKPLFSCKICGKGLTTKASLKSHQETHSISRKRTPCHLCGILVLLRCYNPHIRTCSGRRDFRCYFCQKQFGSSDSLCYHLRTFHTKEKPYLRDRCPYRSAYPNFKCRRHLDSQKDFHPCYFCCKQFASGKTYVKQHITRRHTKERFFKCKYCSKRFPTSGDLKIHMKVGGGREEARSQCLMNLALSNGDGYGKVTCPKCFRVLSTKAYLLEHLKTHDDIFNREIYQCSVCSKVLQTKPGLRKHMKTHDTNRKKFTCEECGSSFFDKGNLKAHKISQHSTRIKTPCPQCGKGLLPESYNSHLRLVHGQPRFICYFCGRGFQSSSNFMTHMLNIHVKEKAFKCNS